MSFVLHALQCPQRSGKRTYLFPSVAGGRKVPLEIFRDQQESSVILAQKSSLFAVLTYLI